MVKDATNHVPMNMIGLAQTSHEILEDGDVPKILGGFNYFGLPTVNCDRTGITLFTFCAEVKMCIWLYIHCQSVTHAMYEIKEGRFCWEIHVSTDMYGNILKIVASLNSDVHEATNPVIEGSSMWFFKIFISSPIKGVSTKSIFLKDISTGKGEFWNVTSSFVFFTQY